MKPKRKPIALTKLADDSAPELRTMVAELCNGKPENASDGGRVSHWSRRFKASGKSNQAPKLRPR